jgi:uncharacterized protein (TIGR03435 family)
MRLEILLAHPAVQALGRALLHFVWQGPLLALLLWIVRAIVPSAAARLRYAAASLILLTMPTALIVTATWNPHSELGRAGPAARISTQAPATPPRAAVYDAPTSSAPRAGIPGWIACIWMIGVLLLSARTAGGWMGVRRLKRGAVPADPAFEQMADRLKRSLRVSAPVRLGTSAMVRVPTVIGWLRPWILLPVTALTGLSEPQLAAILAHELAHIRRHDYLLNLLQTVIETVLFYHPAVWWVGRQMRLEREHCCDDLAVTACGSAFEYANALAEMEQLRDRIPTPALAANGGELLGRIRRVLGHEDLASRPMGAIAAAALVLMIASATAIISLHAAPQEAPPAFEVASIKLDISSEPGWYARWFPTLHIEKMTLKDLVILAYRVHDFELTGGPGWINSERYDIDAKAEPHAAANQEFVALQRRRLQTLLRDRFHLTIHRETRELPIYQLIVAKGGPKLRPVNCIERVTGDTAIAPGKKPEDYCGGLGGSMASGRLDSRGAPMGFFASVLSNMLRRTVVDRTGLAGNYAIHLTFTPEPPAVPPSDPSHPPTGVAVPDAGPSIFSAIQEQFGLKLEAAKGPVEVLVIDHVERPSEN